MKAENWKTIREILQEVWNLSPSERVDFFQKSDLSEEMKGEVESFLACEAESKDFMSLAISDFSKDFLPPDEFTETGISLVGQKIGIYEISGELGGGGMGTVYLARRTDGKFEQKVAVKMLRREFNNEKIRRHFRREKEIQAKLNHPNIARLLDAGTTDDGIPFLVMEYIEGVPVNEFCAAKNLSLKERLKIFNKICEAVAIAHRNLIVHRDLKSSNILIDEKGEPKLLDFGISKILDEENASDSQTVTMLGAMTPEYASPEQIKGETITTATDIYSLGVVLFRILTGVFPYDFKNKTNGKLLKEITDSEPILASGAAIESDSDGKIPASELKGDLDRIIQKSLAKEAARRYQTVEQFSADIWRFIDGKPILARPATASYRARKYFQRNKISVIAAALIILSLFTGIAVALWQARKANAQANLAIESQKKSDDEREKAEKISRFMFKVFSYANPAWYAEGAKTGGQARVLDALDDLSGKIEAEFPEDIDVQAELHHRFGEVFSWTGRNEKDPTRKEYFLQKARFHIPHALELRKQFYGEWHELVAKDLYYNFMGLGESDAEQAAVLMQAIEMMRSTNPNNLNLPHMLTDYSGRLMMPDFAEKHEAYTRAVTPRTDENKYQIAERFMREAIPIFLVHYKEDNLMIYIIECRLAYTLAMQEKWTELDAPFAVCKQGEARLKQFYTVDGVTPTTPLDSVRQILAEKGIVR